LAIQIKRLAHCRVAQARHLHQFHDLDAPFVQPDDLLAPLVQLLQGLVSRVFFFHAGLEQQIILKFNLYEFNSIRLMARLPRLTLIIQRGNNRQPIFRVCGGLPGAARTAA
jgi:hypothetical protein